MREIITTAKTVEEATENGCRELGLCRDEVSVEILEMPVRKFFKSVPAKVKITEISNASLIDEETPKSAPAAPAKKSESSHAGEKPAEKATKAAAPSAKDNGKLLPQEPEEEINLEQNPRVKSAVDYLMSIITAIGAGDDVQITAVKQGDATLLRVMGQSVAQKMEIRGETIQALSYLIDRAVNTGVDKKENDYVRIRLDIAGYRNRRESELMALAQRTGEEVAKTHRSRTLAPMNPYERLIVHTAISKIEGITSESIGSDVERRVVVKSNAPDATEGEDWQPPRKGGGREKGRSGGNRDRDRGRGNRSGGRREGGERKSFQSSNTPQREYADKPRDLSSGPIVPEKRDAIRDGEDLPLYGKIEL